MIAVIGAALAAFMWWFVPATPARGGMRTVAGSLVEGPRIHRPYRAGAWASIVVQTPSGVKEGAIRDIGFIWPCARFSLMWGCLEYDALSGLRPGDRVTVGLIDLPGDAAHVFELSRDGRTVLSFDEALAAHRRVRANIMILGWGIAVGGVLLALWRLTRRRRDRARSDREVDERARVRAG